jgi:hypothetical protein
VNGGENLLYICKMEFGVGVVADGGKGDLVQWCSSLLFGVGDAGSCDFPVVNA